MPNYSHPKMVTKWLESTPENISHCQETQERLEKNYDVRSRIEKHPTYPNRIALFYTGTWKRKQ